MKLSQFCGNRLNRLTRLVGKLSVSLDKCHGSIFDHVILNDLP